MPETPNTQSHNSDISKKPLLSTFELVMLVASLSALNALSIDIMLPALSDIQSEFGFANANDRQLIILVFLGAFGIAQLVYGPLSDKFGRRAILIGALVVFLIGSVLCLIAPSFELFLAARALQGVGTAATRVIATAVVRDVSSGSRMAQIMSLSMTIFMTVPIAAPGLGQLLLLMGSWRVVFIALLVYGAGILIWTMLRLPETLPPEQRRALNPRSVAGAYWRVLATPQSVGYMAASTFMAGALFGYVAAAEQIYRDFFKLDALFPFAFAAVAIAMSVGTSLNARFVMRLGMRRISHTMAIWFIAMGLLHAVLNLLGAHALWVFLPLLSLTVGVFGMVAGNYNALAMEPLGNVAGSASALYGAATATGGAILGRFVASAYDGSLAPFLIGLVLLGLASLSCVLLTERGRLFYDPPESDVRIAVRGSQKR